jgi:hypothetical protein
MRMNIVLLRMTEWGCNCRCVLESVSKSLDPALEAARDDKEFSGLFFIACHPAQLPVLKHYGASLARDPEPFTAASAHSTLGGFKKLSINAPTFCGCSSIIMCAAFASISNCTCGIFP